MKKFYRFSIVFLGFCLAHPAFAQVPLQPDSLQAIPIQGNDARIIGVVAAMDQNEVQIARTAEDKNIDLPIKEYAWAVNLEYQRNLRQVLRLARQLGIKPAYDAGVIGRLRTTGIFDVGTLAPLDRDDFSREFIWELMEQYSDALTWIDSQATHSPQLRKFLDETRGYIAIHLQAAQTIQEMVLR